MTDWFSFDGVVETMEWGDNTYTIVRLPTDIANALAALGAKRVEGEFNEHPVNLALTKAPVVEGVFLWAGKSLLKRVNLAPGERFEARLQAADPNAVEVADDVEVALRQADVTAAWESLTPGQKRSRLYAIDTAKRSETRQRRIEALVDDLI